MKILSRLLAVFIVLVIAGGLGYLGWNTFLASKNHSGLNMNPDTQAPQGQNQMPHGQTSGQQAPHGSTSKNNTQLNTAAMQNRDMLSQAIGTINQAIDLISIDPYSKATLPQENDNNMQTGNNQGQAGQGTGTINIYPDGNSSVNIAPNGNNAPNIKTTPAPNNQGAANMQQNKNYVFDQGKLEQLHNGIFTLSQGIMVVNQLNDDLLMQSAIVEPNPPNNDTYVARYNAAMQNRNKLNNAITKLSQASILINVNPYAPAGGYSYNKDAMGQLHQGVYKLAQGMAMLGNLSEEFTNQMVQASTAVQNSMGTSGHIGMTNGFMWFDGLFGNVSMTTIFNIILVVLMIGLVLGVLGAIMSMLSKSNKKNNQDSNPDNDPNVI